MQKNAALTSHALSALFDRFCFEMQMLPSYTPIFLIDSKGRIAEKRNLFPEKACIDNVVSLVSEDCLSEFAENMLLCDAFFTEVYHDGRKEYMVISKDEEGFSRCVVCLMSDKGCTKLHDYYENLSGFKDYLDSFSGISFSGTGLAPVIRIFKSRMNGAAELLRLSRHGADGSRISFPLKPALEKLSKLACAMNPETSFGIDIDGVGEDVFIRASENFFKLVISLFGFEMRNSCGGIISVNTWQADEKDAVYMCFSAKAENTENTMFKTALERAFRNSGFEVFTSESDGKISFTVGAEQAKKVPGMLLDPETLSEQLDTVLTDTVLMDLYLMMSDSHI